jgi:hypothetical protein
VFRRPRGEGQGENAGENREGGNEHGGPGWRVLLAQAVDEFNASLHASGSAFACALEEDEAGFVLQFRRTAEGGEDPEIEEELLDPTEFPKWLARLRSRLGILMDQSA